MTSIKDLAPHSGAPGGYWQVPHAIAPPGPGEGRQQAARRRQRSREIHEERRREIRADLSRLEQLRPKLHAAADRLAWASRQLFLAPDLSFLVDPAYRNDHARFAIAADLLREYAKVPHNRRTTNAHGETVAELIEHAASTLEQYHACPLSRAETLGGLRALDDFNL